MTSVITAGFTEQIDPQQVEAVRWARQQDQPRQDNTATEIHVNTRHRFQQMRGIGGAFSELGSRALKALDNEKQKEVFDALFDGTDGADLNFCRIPIGASDFALDAYSLNDNAGDYAMTLFDAQRDDQFLVPFIKRALEVNPAMIFHASPWSPPAWLKTSDNMISGSLKDNPETYKAYAKYFRRFIEAYRERGIPVDHIVVQNEPDTASAETLNQEENPTVFPCCLMPPRQMVTFVTKYLLPELRSSGLDTDVWGGTFRTITGLWSHVCAANETFRRAVAGIGFQYSFPGPIRDLRELYPDLETIHTESVCHNGSNSRLQAASLFLDFVDYVEAGCSAYTYWNMVLDETGESSWGWKQNCLVTADRKRGQFYFNPDFDVMKLLSSNISPGASRVESFCFARRSIAFANPDHSLVIFTMNLGERTGARLIINGREELVDLPENCVAAIATEAS